MMKDFSYKIIFLAMMILVSLFSPQVYAIETDAFNSDFSIEITPNNPAPGTQVLAEVVSYQFDVDRSVITWVLGGKKVADGIGKRKINFVTPNFGSNNSLVVSIVTDKGMEVSKTVNFSGDDIDLLWEAGTDAPDWYKGRALPAKKSYVRFYAIPHVFSGGVELSPSSLIYDWYVNNKKIPKASGFNERGIVVRLNDDGEYSIGVEVSNKNRSVKYKKTIEISSQGVKPKAVIYENSPTKGILFGKALGRTFNMSSRDMSMIAEAFNFIKSSPPALTYKWMVNGKKINQQNENSNIINFKAADDSGLADVKALISGDIGSISQSANSSLRINF